MSVAKLHERTIRATREQKSRYLHR